MRQWYQASIDEKKYRGSSAKWCCPSEPEACMSGKWIKVRSSEGGDFDCYLNVPKIDTQVPAVVLASAVHGVDADIVAIADELAAHDVVAAAPDLFWRA